VLITGNNPATVDSADTPYSLFLILKHATFACTPYCFKLILTAVSLPAF